ncbi:MAG: nucleoside deaminase [Legionella sp.]|nr:nucleoside deaminase [Legionella sp.]
MCNKDKKIIVQRYLKVLFLAVLSIQVFAADLPGKHKIFLNKTFQLAQLSRQKGNHPFGALLVYRGRIILTAENLVISTQDVTAHAEMVLIRQASKQFSKEILKHSTLYTSTKPCAMCSGAIYWAGISRVVYGCSTQTLEKLAHGGLAISSKEIFKQGKRDVRANGPYFEEAAIKVHKGFWS